MFFTPILVQAFGMAGMIGHAEPNPLAPTFDHFLDLTHDALQEVGENQKEPDSGNKYVNTYNTCADCMIDHVGPEDGADAILHDANSKPIATLKLRNGKIDTIPIK